MRPIFKIIFYTKHLWKWYIFMGVFVVIVSLLSLVGPLLIKQIVDLIVLQIKGQKVDFSLFMWFLIAIILSDLLITLLTTFAQWIGDILTVRLQTYLSGKFYQHILNLHIGFYDNEITGTIVNKMYRGITSITEFIQSMLNNFLPFFLTALVTIILLAKYSLFIGLLLAVLFPVYILISHSSSLTWKHYEEQKNILNDSSQGRVFESISGIRVVKAFVSQMLELSNFLTARNKIEKLTIDQTRKWHWYDFLRRICLNIILFSIFSYIVYWTFRSRYTIGEMTLLLQLVNQARFPLFAMSFILGQIQQASAGSADFFRVLDIKNQIQDSQNAISLNLKSINDKKIPFVEFKNITFKYENGNNVLQKINFKIYSGEKLALVGESGQGKSTIVNLLLRYYVPHEGEIKINNQNITHLKQESLRQNIAVVFQESLLFSGTIKENISYSHPKASRLDIIAGAKAANAHEFIQKLPQQYDSLIGERGVKLSGGQKQRIAIARAMLKNAPLIILDEATSSLDSKAEILVQKGLDHLMQNRTSLIIAHRLSTIANANHVVVIADGTISQDGTPTQLLDDKKGLYYQLVNLQQQLLKSPSEDKISKLQQYDLIV